jgi:glycosyltransferase involved in cell wall biosynthesis
MAARRMRRLTVMQLLPALESGGVERSTLEIARALAAAGHRSIVVSAGGRLLPELLAGGSEHIALPIGRKSLTTLRQVPVLRRWITELAPDVVHARSRLPAWVARGAMRGLGDRRPAFVTTVHGLNSPGRYSGVMASGDRVICVSQTVRRHVLTQWPATDPDKLVVIERGIDPTQFPRVRVPDATARALWQHEHPVLAGGAPVLLLPGRGTRLKGHAAAIELLATLRAGGRDARLWLLGAREPGRAAYVAELEQLAARRGVSAQVEIAAPRSDIAEAYAMSDLVLQLSDRPEAFGRTVLEALSVGRPVLGWDHGGVGEQLRALFPSGAVAPGDHAALAAAADAIARAPMPDMPMLGDTLAAMQRATLKVYDALVD